MAIKAARGLPSNQIRCPDCRTVRVVVERQARRWREGHITGLCRRCRFGSPAKPRDQDYGYWLTAFGHTPPQGQKARDYVIASGVPANLAKFAKDCFPH